MEKLKAILLQLSGQYKNKILILRFLKNHRFIELFYRKEIHEFVEENKTKSIDEVAESILNQISKKHQEFTLDYLKTILYEENTKLENDWNEQNLFK